MATISDRLGHFDGQIGSVVFTNGTGNTTDVELLAYFAADSDRWDVTDTEPAGWADLSDAELVEAYATNVGGNATSRRGHIKALQALDNDQE